LEGTFRRLLTTAKIPRLSEIRRIVTEGYDKAKTLLTEHLEKLHCIASALLEKEVLDGAEIDKIISGEVGAPCPA